MLDPNYISDNLERVERACKSKNASVDVRRIAHLNAERKAANARFDELRHEKKTLGNKIQEAKKQGQDAADLLARSNLLKDEEKEAQARVREVETALEALLPWVPNIPHPDVPEGDASHNRVVRTWGTRRQFDFAPLDHLALCEKHGVDTGNRGVKVAGSGFALFTGRAARLCRTLINFFLDTHTEQHDYVEISPPLLVNRKTMTGTGQLPKLEEDMYHLDREDLFLIPTAEVPVTNLLQDEVLSHKDLPVAYAAYTPCFRREAGAYGKDTKGLMRLHQFDKVEMVRFCEAGKSEAEHDVILGHAEKLLQMLGLEYRVLELATGDMSFAAHRCYDLEVYAPASQRWFECSSVSNFHDFQARRANIRYRDDQGKMQFCHTLNGSGLALPRIVLCLLETHQRADGSVLLPEVLRRGMGSDAL